MDAHASGHSHASLTSAGGQHRTRLAIALGISALVLVVEVIGSAVTGSLALLADAGHVLTDAAGILLALMAVTFASRPASSRRTFGYYRLEILAAVINAVLLFCVAVYILFEAWQRWFGAEDVDGGLMVAFACVGLVANLVAFFILRDGAASSLNVRGAYLEVLGDLLGSIAVIGAAVVILLTGWEKADVIASVLVALMILPRTWTLLREAVDVLLEAAPRGLDVDEVRRSLMELPGVVGIHDLHAWTITSGQPVLSAHVVVTDAALADGGAAALLDLLGETVHVAFGIEHCTFQLEPSGHAGHEFTAHA